MTYTGPWSTEYIEQQYRLWQQDPESVGKDWQFFFQGFELGLTEKPARAEEPSAEEGVCEPCDEESVRKQSKVEALVYRYRDIGHLLSCLDPLAACPTDHPLLNAKAFGLEEADMDRRFYIPGLSENREQRMTLREAINHLRQTYCRSVGVEYMHLQDPAERKWLRERMEATQNRPAFSGDEKTRIFRKLTEASRFEQFIHRKYLGQKRFSVEGADVIVPMIDALFAHAANAYDCRQVVLGMTHRGRLSVQTNILNKPYEDVFREFEDQYNPEAEVGAGDVKYHKGFHGQITTLHDKAVDIIMADNPSHLESVDPVVEGMARAGLDEMGRENTRQLMPLLLHGDAAFTGQGIVAETLNMSQLDGYHTGGTVHIVVNNQIGYTALPEDLRSTRYATDIAKSLMIPIFHVHGENPEAAVHTIQLACDYRMAHGKDVVIDVVCYRRYGHNEGDEPYFTQPLMYERIKNRPTIDELYAEQLKEKQVLEDAQIKSIRDETQQCIQAAFDKAREEKQAEEKDSVDAGEVPVAFNTSLHVDTRVDASHLNELAETLNAVPEAFQLHRKLSGLLKKRREAVQNGQGIDWGNAEALAFATIVDDGIAVRLCGQDSQRGTFSQRHSVLFDTETNDEYVPLNHVGENQARFEAINSLLSEAGALGFEYGYSVMRPEALTLWEAQFGDFINNAQAIIDLYIAAGEAKWGCKSGLVMLLPHGYEGQGPEHSSARFERFLQLAADDNLCVCNPSTPAQYFHLLRRQAVGQVRKPLVVLTPKSLLRHPKAVATLGDLAEGHFHPVIDDRQAGEDVEKVVLVSGKLYYELAKARDELGRTDMAIVRVEQLYPFAEEAIDEIVTKYESCDNWVWAQEEPANMGAWQYIRPLFERRFSLPLTYVGRKAAASPATGFHYVFKQEQQRIIDQCMKA